MYRRFGLVLTVNHECNMHCTYCYAGAKFNRPMAADIGQKAVDRAVASIEPGGALKLGFFGGEPLLEAPLILGLIDHARYRATAGDVDLELSLTTNGTVTGSAAWSVMTLPDLNLAVSHDGLPAIHNQHRRLDDGSPSSAVVLKTIKRLARAGKDFRVVMVVRPDNLDYLSAGMVFLRSLGVRRVEPSLDLWCCWTPEDARRLETVIAECARAWCERFPEFGVSWFEEKVVHLAGLRFGPSARCGFGDGEIAVAPSGNLYPCERLIREDSDSNPMRLPGHVLDGDDFLDQPAAPCRSAEACLGCRIRSMCNTTCRCSNYVRTGDVGMPDGLLCLFNRVCARETAKALELVYRGVGV